MASEIEEIARSLIEGDVEEAATLFLSLPQNQRKVVSGALIRLLEDSKETWTYLSKSLMHCEEIMRDNPPPDLDFTLLKSGLDMGTLMYYEHFG